MADWLGDQAAGLRKLVARDRTRSICFNGGRGGTGTTSAVINLAHALSNLGKRVLVLDEHIGQSNVAARLGMKPQTATRIMSTVEVRWLNSKASRSSS